MDKILIRRKDENKDPDHQYTEYTYSSNLQFRCVLFIAFYRDSQSYLENPMYPKIHIKPILNRGNFIKYQVKSL